MKKIFIILTTVLLCSHIALAYQADKVGVLNILSKNSNTHIYVDGELKGNDAVSIKDIPVGSHFVKVTSYKNIPETTLFAELVQIKANEVTTIVIDEKANPQGQKQKVHPEDVTDVYKAKKMFDYSGEVHTGWYLKVGYITNKYYSLNSESLNFNAANIGIGLGFKLPITSNFDFSLELDRANLSTSNKTWFYMPVSANLMLSYLPSKYFRGRQYYGIGLAYFMTDLENNMLQNLTCLGYHLFYGVELPASDASAYVLQLGYQVADLSRYGYSLNTVYGALGYRFDVIEQ